MNFEPPDHTKPSGIVQFQNKVQNSSPLLRSFSNNKNFETNGPSVYQNRHNLNGNHQFREPVRNRLGNKTFQKRNDNRDATQISNNNQQGQRLFNRKRRDVIDGNAGPVLPKRKWGVVNNSYYQNTNNNQQNNNSAQNRLNRIRNSSVHGSDEQIVVKTENSAYFNDSQDIDATDITVEVVNHNAQAVQEETPTRFKMILNPKTQAAIKLLQSKRRDKQVIFPFPVTPNSTGISLHERFSIL